LETLSWTARGKRSWEIANILGVSRKIVDFDQRPDSTGSLDGTISKTIRRELRPQIYVSVRGTRPAAGRFVRQVNPIFSISNALWYFSDMWASTPLLSAPIFLPVFYAIA